MAEEAAPPPPAPQRTGKDRLGSRSSRASRGEEPDREGGAEPAPVEPAVKQEPAPLSKPSRTTPPPDAAVEPPPKKEKEATRLLDELFRKTKTTPCIYWLPLTEEEVSARRKECVI